MIGYITLGTNDIIRAAAFYDVLLAELSAARTMETETFIAWGATPEGVSLCVIKPFDGQVATVGNGVMVALAADSRETVDRVYNKAIALGAQDEGPAGARSGSYYAGYFRDLDGNKLNVFYMGD